MSSWNIQPSITSVHTINPIRNIVDKIERPKNHALPIIDLALGDPAVFGNLPPPKEALDAVNGALMNPKTHGYTASTGNPVAREAVAKFMTARTGVEYGANDIVIASGASQAIFLCIQLLCNAGDSLLIPKPGFSLYETICGHMGVHAQFYDLDSTKSWEIDLQKLETLIVEANGKGQPVKGMLLCNPGNPTGSNYSKEHLLNVASLCQKYKIPVIADEIYGDIVFNQEVFTPFASLCEDIPCFTISGLAKQFLVPGWRVGWIAVTDRAKHLAAALPHLVSLTQVILGATTVIQCALPAILANVPESHFKNLNKTLESHANIIIEECKNIPGITCVTPQGAMYAMLRIDCSQFKDIADDTQFSQLLLTEMNLLVLPGACFKADGFIRLVFCAPQDKIKEALQRLKDFCIAHKK